jgi:hypothetical protein
MESTLWTRWGRALLSRSTHDSKLPGDTGAKLPISHPRPTLRRPDLPWLSLNGIWDFEIVETSGKNEELQELKAPSRFDQTIRVPFPIESSLSGVRQILLPKQTAWYRRFFELPEEWGGVGQGFRAILHFGAVDWECAVFFDGRILGIHRGGYDPFSFDITEVVAGRSDHEILVAVRDPTSEGIQPRGKQVLHPHGIWYTPCSGIWQDVWVEMVPETYVESLQLYGDPVESTATATVMLRGSGSARATVFVEIVEGGEVVAVGKGEPSRLLRIEMPHGSRPWSAEDPFLYEARIRVEPFGGHGAATGFCDRVSSYIGFRRIEVRTVKGIPRIFLNGSPVFLLGFLDQGYWPDGIYTPPSDDALEFDISLAKSLGANTLRKHVKVESEKFYHACDRLGILVLQDFPSGTFGHTEEGRKIFRREVEAHLRARYNHPSIVGWVIFNEGWGQHDTCELVDWVRHLDPTRLVIGASGWVDRGCGDLADLHIYPGLGKLGKMPLSAVPDIWFGNDEESVKKQAELGVAEIPNKSFRPLIFGEFGGLGLEVAGHSWEGAVFSYKPTKSRQDLTAQYVALLGEIAEAAERGLSGAIYTQLADVEGEHNGMITYDREVVKVSVPEARRAAERVVRMGLDRIEEELDP